MTLFSVTGDHACGLFFEHLLDAAREGLGEGVNEQQRDGGNKAKHRGHQGLGDTAGHDARVTGTEQGDLGEGLDHTGNGTQKTQQRCDTGSQLEEVETEFELRRFLQDGFVELELDVTISTRFSEVDRSDGIMCKEFV